MKESTDRLYKQRYLYNQANTAKMPKTRTQIKRFDKETSNALELENMYDIVSSLSSLCGEKNKHLIDQLVSKIMRLRDSEISWMVMYDELEELYAVRGEMLKTHGVDVNVNRESCKCSVCDKKQQKA